MQIIRIILKVIGISLGLVVLFFAFNHLLTISIDRINEESYQIQQLLESDKPIVCVLRTDRRKYKIGESPQLSVEIINNSDSTILMVGCLDGSEIGFRPPISRFSIKHKIIGKPYGQSCFCPMVNPIRSRDFQVIKPNESFDPYMEIDDEGYFSAQGLEGHNFYIPGIYEISYFYSTLANIEGQKIDGLYSNKSFTNDQIYPDNSDDKIESLWNSVPKVELISNTIIIEYGL